MSEKAAREQIVREISDTDPRGAVSLDELVKRLLSIMNRKDDSRLSVTNNQRRRYADILGEMGAYFVEMGHDECPELGIYIASLGVALEDLIDGITDSLFKTKGSKRDSKRTWGGRLQASLGLECFIMSGLSRSAAVKLAAGKYKGLKRLLRGNRDLKRSLLSWYDRYVEGHRVPVPQLLENFQIARHQIKSANVSPAEYRRWGQRCFALAVKWARR
jgi:hypothetical protein